MVQRRHVVKSMVLIRRPRDGAYLVSTDTDAFGNVYERPLGGHVEFGEYAADTARREIQEELEQELSELHLLGVLENLFDLDGDAHHEIVFVFTAVFADRRAYDVEEQRILDDPSERIRVRWRDPSTSAPPLVPASLHELIPKE
jgi:ADP-ribose pyrophosphatase YjhB (NUDIX family)